MGATVTAVPDGFVQLIKQVIEDNPDIILNIVKQHQPSTQKYKLTTKEMCQQLGINYSTWMHSDVKESREIRALVDSNSGQHHLYKNDEATLNKIATIWRNRKK